MAKRVILSVSSDLVTDQRVHRSASLLHESGYDVLVTGRRLHNSQPMPWRPYSVKRFQLVFEKGPFFYAGLNLRLFLFLLLRPADILFSNDLDTLLPNYLVSKIKNIPLIYDSHEYFTGVPELQNRPFIKSLWKKIERYIVPKLRYLVTVNESIAALYKTEYNVKFAVVRNIPEISLPLTASKSELRTELGLPADKNIFILQGAGINIQRGAEEAVEAMQFPGNNYLVIAGDGDVIPQLKQTVSRLGLTEKVKFIPKQQPDMLRRYTAAADAGLTLDKDTNVNYKFSLPNKLFDYIHAGIPVIASDLTEIRNIILNYRVGIIIKAHEPVYIAEAMHAVMETNFRSDLLSNLKKAAGELQWSHEKKNLLKVIESIP